MKSGTDRHARSTVRIHGRRRRTVGSLAAALGAWTLALTGLAPAAAAEDVQAQQWYLDAMHADDMWKTSTGEGIKVAVVDTGVSETPSLKGQLLPGKDLTGRSGDATDDYQGHGTSMAELIAGSGAGGGLKGLAPGAKVIPYRVTLGRVPGAEADSYKGIRAAADGEARIINMSFGGEDNFTFNEDAINYALKKGKLLFAATGNDGGEELHYPAAFDGVVGVSAADDKGTVADFSQHGKTVDLASPGAEVPAWCDATLKKYCPSEGTSQASAIASASAALVWSAHPDWTANQVLRTLIDTAGRSWPKNTPSNYLGYGLIRPRLVLAESVDPGPADVDPITGQKTEGVPPATAPSGKASQAPSGKPGQGESSGETSAAASDTAGSGDDGQMWAIIGAAAAVVVIGGAFAFMRMRRAR